MKTVHKEIKPSTLLINSQGEIKIAGYVSKSCYDPVGWLLQPNCYDSPERITGEKYGYDTDIWSLGLTIVECALGKYPYYDQAR